jgi:hypothetical protein
MCRPLGRTRRGWEDNIQIDLQEAGCGDHLGEPGEDGRIIFRQIFRK